MLFRVTKLRKTIGVTLGAALALWCAPAFAQKHFESAQQAIDALVSAARAGDKTAIIEILGPDGEDIVSSGDEVADRATRDKFIAAYDAKHSLTEENGETIVVIGDDDWPFPIPIVQKDKAWEFATAEGIDEILRRRIGRDELAAIKVAHAYVDAQKDYAALDPNGPVYAQRIVSSPGKKDGLYWPTEDGETPSPLGELMAQASAEGYKVGDKPIPYHGYFYRILKRQGDGAPGGARDYVVDGKMTGGFALIAFPATYGNSGIMTFMVNQDGTVFQKDLGPDSEDIAEKTDSFSPDETWSNADEAN
jgi:Protein of unknown function (DUF2950)